MSEDFLAFAEGTVVGDSAPAAPPAAGAAPAGRGLLTAIARGVWRRAVQLVISLAGLSIVLFSLLHASGNPAFTIAGPNASAATIRAITQQLGLTKPLIIQYLLFLEHIVTLNFGTSTSTGTSAGSVVWSRLPYTLDLGLWGLVIALVIAIPLGTWLAMRSRSLGGRAVHLVIKAGQAVPGFVVGLLLILVFAEHLRLFPVFGSATPSSEVLPAAALASYLIPKLTRMTRAAAREALAQEHVIIARAKGLSELHIAVQYVMRNCLVTVTALLSLQIAQLVSGAVVIESLFAWPGVGRLMVSSVLSGDFAVVEASVVYIAIVISVINAVLDSIVPLLDPRIRAVR